MKHFAFTMILLFSLILAAVAGDLRSDREKFQGANLTKDATQTQSGITVLTDSLGNQYYNITLKKLSEAVYLTESGQVLVLLPAELNTDQRGYIISQLSTWQLEARAFQKK